MTKTVKPKTPKSPLLEYFDSFVQEFLRAGSFILKAE